MFCKHQYYQNMAPVRGTIICLLLWAVAINACDPTITTASGTKAPATICAGDLIFDDEFDDFDLSVWEHEITQAGGGNWEFEIYYNNRSNSFTQDGILHIRPTLVAERFGEEYLSTGNLKLWGGAPADACTNNQDWGCERTGTAANLLSPVFSARIRTDLSFNFKYGKLEIRAKLPAGDWLWPAIWMLPRYNAYSSWPASGEVDIMESRGNLNLVQNGVNIGSEQISSTLHFGPYWPLNGYMNAHFATNSAPGNGYDKDFHRYQMEWTADHMKFSIDDVEVGTVAPPDGGFWELGGFSSQNPTAENPWRAATKMAPFDQEFYILMNVAVGGVNNFFPDDAENPGGKPWSNNGGAASTDFWNGRSQWLPTWNMDQNMGESSSLLVDYVKVWAL